MSLYLILDTNHADYNRYVQAIADVATSTFTPRLNNDGSKAIIQIKQGPRGYDTKAISWVEKTADRTAVVLGSGNIHWVKAQLRRNYTPKTGNEWKDADPSEIEIPDLVKVVDMTGWTPINFNN